MKEKNKTHLRHGNSFKEFIALRRGKLAYIRQLDNDRAIYNDNLML